MLSGDLQPGDVVIWQDRDTVDSFDLLLAVERYPSRHYPDWLVFTWLGIDGKTWTNTNLPWSKVKAAAVHRMGQRIS